MSKKSAEARLDRIYDQVDARQAHCAVRQQVPKGTSQEAGKWPAPSGAILLRRDRAVSHQDVLPFVNMLKSMAPIDDLDLIVVSPGGDGTAAETMLEQCRTYCKNKLRIVVPSYAKSAATLLALWADEIVMGETAELGPIDAQVFILQDGAEQQVSADHFLRAHKKAIDDLAATEPNVVESVRHRAFSLLSPAFLQKCLDMMNFANDFAGEQLRAHMFKAEFKADKTTWDKRIDDIVENLTGSEATDSYTCGMITARQIKADKDLKHLKITELANDDPYWTALNELLLRTGACSVPPTNSESFCLRRSLRCLEARSEACAIIWYRRIAADGNELFPIPDSPAHHAIASLAAALRDFCSLIRLTISMAVMCFLDFAITSFSEAGGR